MEHAGTTVAAGPPEQLDQGYQLDIDPNAVLDTEGLDFAVDGSYEEVEGSYEEIEHVLEGEIPDDAAALDLDPKHGDARQEAHSPSPAEEQAETTEVAENAGNDAEVEGDYQDEIGYEDDDFATTDLNGDLGAIEAGEGDAGLPDTSFEGHLELAQPADDTHQEASSRGRDAFSDQESGFEEQNEKADLPGELGDAAEKQAAGEEAGEHVEGNGSTVDGFDDWAGHEQSAMEEELSELGNALEDLSHSLPASIPRVEVLYNEESYSLIGAPEDDPDSYFLSEAKELDRPLSRFLSALRAVISDDVSPSDELVVRYEPLDLEFGERSNESFLNRTFREILDCHATLGQVPGVSGDPVIHLSVRRDAEEQFLELLAEAELVKGVPRGSADSEMSEDQDNVPDNARDDEHVEDEAFGDEDLDDYHGEAEHDVTDHVENGNEAEPEQVADDRDDSAAGQKISQPGPSAPQFSSVAAETAQSEGHTDDVGVEAHDHGSPEEGAGELGAWDEQVAEEYAPLQQHAETPVQDERTKDSTEQQESDELLEAEFAVEIFDEQTHQPSEQQGSDEALEMAKLGSEDDAAAPQQAESSLELFDEQTHEATEQEVDEPLEITANEAAAPVNGGLEQQADANGKYLSFLRPARASTDQQYSAAVSPLRDNDRVDVLMGEEVPGQVSATALEPEEFWEIDYSDDEDESAPSDHLEADASPTSEPQAHRTMSLEYEPNSKWTRADPSGSFGASKTESIGVSMARSFNTDANQNAYQDDDLVLAFDDEPAISTIREERYEQDEYAITYEASDIGANDAEGMPEPDAAETALESLGESSVNGVPARIATETSSVHTSTTINGDEIDYEEENAADDSLTAADDGAQQSAAASGVNDEIDWENDEDDDEYEQQPADEDDGVEFEESNEAALSPPGNSGKRSRTDETESLADETDHKRRRT